MSQGNVTVTGQRIMGKRHKARHRQRDFEKCQAELNAELLAVERAENQAKHNLSNAITRAKRWLPLEIIYAHGHGQYASIEHQKLMQAVEETIKKAYNGKLIIGFDQWKSFMIWERQKEQESAAVKLQCAWRMYRAVQEVKWRLSERFEDGQRKAQILLLLQTRENQAACRICRFLKVSTGARRLRHQENACQVLQRFFQRRMSKWALVHNSACASRRDEAAIKLQCCYRRFCARKKTKILLKIRRVDKRDAFNMRQKELRSAWYRRHGAALCIQQRWKRKLEKRKYCYARLNRKHERKNAASTTLQALWRRHCAISHVRIARIQQIRAVCVIQCAVRCWLSRRIYMGKVKGIRRHRNNESLKAFVPETMPVTHRKFGGKPTLHNEARRLASIKIQSYWRGCRSRKKVQKKRARIRELSRRNVLRLQRSSAILIQKIVRGIIGRKIFWELIVLKSCVAIQRLWKGYRMRCTMLLIQERLHAVAIIKKHWNQSKARHHRKVHHDALLKLQAFARGLKERGNFFKLVRSNHFIEEQKTLGAALFERSIRVVSRRLISFNFYSSLNSSREVRRKVGPDVAIAGVWQDLYVDACQWNTKGSLSTIDNVRFIRFFKSIPGLLNDEFTVQNLDIIFSAVADKGTRHICYSQFMIATKKILRLRWSEAEEGEALLLIVDQIFESAWGNFFAVSLRNIALEHLDWAAIIVQKFIRSVKQKQATIKDHLNGVQKLNENHQAMMAIRIQRMWRVRDSRKRVGIMLSKIVVEYIDGSTGIPFYVNPLTGTTMWNRPKLLYKAECCVSIRLPLPGEEFVAYCQHHIRDAPDHRTDIVATIYCHECLEALCPSCFTRSHSRESTSKHTTSNIECCSTCKLQTATRICNQCRNGSVMFCDACYIHLHRIDSIRGHSYTELVVMCCECEIKAAQWKCSECIDVYCKTCYASMHRKGNRQNHSMLHLPFYSVIERQADERRAAKREREELESIARAKRDNLRAIVQKQELEQAVLRIQSRYRAKRAREQGKEYMRLVRQTQRALEQRMKDDIMRNKLTYKMRDAFGAANDLKSDTLQEKQLRQYRKNMINRVALLTGVETETLQYLKSDTSSDQASRSADISEVPSWCCGGNRVVVTRGEYKNCTASVLSTSSMNQNGMISVFVEAATTSANIPFLHLRPRLSDEEEKIRSSAVLSMQHGLTSGFLTATSKLKDAKHGLSMRISDAMEQKMINTQIAFMENVEFKDIVEFAWKEVPGDEQADGKVTESQTSWWNVVTNAKVTIMPRGAKNFQAISDNSAREEILSQMDRAEKKLRKILQTNIRYDSGARDRRNALDGSFIQQKVIGAANKFFTTVNSDEFSNGQITKGLSGADQQHLWQLMNLLDDTAGYSYLRSYLTTASLGEKQETIQELLRMDPESDEAQSHLHRLSNLTLDQKLQRRSDIDKRRGLT